MVRARGGVDGTVDGEVVAATMAAWSREHPRATLTEIEDAVDTELAQVRQRLVEASIQTQVAADAARSPQRQACPGCAEEMHAKGRRRRSLRTKHGGVIELERSYWWCPRCRAGFFPPG